MSASRKFLWLPFWLAVLLTALGYVILYPLVARLGCFLLAAGLSAGAIFITGRGHRIAAALLFIVALASAYDTSKLRNGRVVEAVVVYFDSGSDTKTVDVTMDRTSGECLGATIADGGVLKK